MSDGEKELTYVLVGLGRRRAGGGKGCSGVKVGREKACGVGE